MQGEGEVERILSFTQVQGQFEHYVGALKGNKSQRKSALMELRAAFYFARNSFPINQWNPVGAKSREGEYLLGCPSGADIFTEVKSPGWESELTEEERSARRTVQPKYIDGEARSVAPWQAIQFAVEKAYPKFLPNIPNLLVLADDLFIGLEHGTDTQVGMARYSRHYEGCFTDGRNERLGGVGIFWIVNDGKEIAYDIDLPPRTSPPSKLDSELFEVHSTR